MATYKSKFEIDLKIRTFGYKNWETMDNKNPEMELLSEKKYFSISIPEALKRLVDILLQGFI
ncbi:MAG: hypothetical protein NUV73_04495 [Candidatus Daviesbacteria bacterium]|nr:hypothetical protein [Candidatus Daviesbacteria bacterium]